MQNHWAVLASGRIVVPSSAEELWDAAVSYFMWCDDTPIENNRPVMSGREAGRQITEQLIRPYTIKGLCLHCGITEEYLADVKKSRDNDSIYYAVVMRILYCIYVQNQELATVGVFNPIFTSRVLEMDDFGGGGGALTVRIIRDGGTKALSNSESEVLEKMDLESVLSKNGVQKT